MFLMLAAGAACREALPGAGIPAGGAGLGLLKLRLALHCYLPIWPQPRKLEFVTSVNMNGKIHQAAPFIAADTN